jgi:hypothetical protein
LTPFQGSVPEIAMFFNGKMHSTSTPGDSCTFSFTGTGVWYFSDLDKTNADVAISVDKGPSELVNTGFIGHTSVCTIPITEYKASLTGLSAVAEDHLEQDGLERRTTHRYYHSCRS